MTHSGNCPEFLSRRPPAKLANLPTIFLFLRIKNSLSLFMAVALELHCHEGLEIIRDCLYVALVPTLPTSESPRGTGAEKYIFSPVAFQTHGMCVKCFTKFSKVKLDNFYANFWDWTEHMCRTALWNSNSSHCAKRGDPRDLSFSFWQRQVLSPTCC